MVSFRRRKKAALGAARLNKQKKKSDDVPIESKESAKKSSTRGRKKKKNPPAAVASIPKPVSKEYTSPLTTIEEHHDETPPTGESSPSVLRSVNVMNTSADESMEAVMGSATSSKSGPSTEPTVLLDEIHVFDNKAASKGESTEVVLESDKSKMHDDIRKKLFSEEENGKYTWTASSTGAEEPPFDVQAEYNGDEDPAILDLVANAEGAPPVTTSETSTNSITDKTTSMTDSSAPTNTFRSDVRDAVMTKKLLQAFSCNTDTTEDRALPFGMDTFYDTMCGQDVGKGKRPFFSKEFSRDFMEDVMRDGIPLMYHYVAEGDGNPDSPVAWRGHSVTMILRQGSYQGLNIEQPRLEWPTAEQMWTTEEPGSVNLMDIQSIIDSSEDEVRDDIADTPETMDLCFFSITTKDGDFYMFESASPAERDWIVTGLKNVIVRLAYHLTVGDPALSSELFSAEYDHATGDLPTLKTPTQAMNEVAHAFLD